MIGRVLRYFLLLLLSACAEGPPGLTPLGENAVVLAFGDSLTRGTGAGEQQSYPAVLSELIDLRVVNEGKPGEISADGLSRLPALLERYEPDLLRACRSVAGRAR